MLKSFVRFGTKHSGMVENFNSGGILCYLDQNGSFTEGFVISDFRNMSVKNIQNLPDTNLPLQGRIPHWDVIESIVEKTDRLFPMLNYLGFDFVVTSDDKVKILEINSLTSLDSFQMDSSVFDSKIGRTFFSDLLSRK